MRYTVTALAFTSLVGCTIAPTVEYTKITQPFESSADIIDSIYLQKSEIVIKQPDSKEKRQDGVLPQIDVSSVPAEETSFRLVIKKADPFYADTNLNISKIPNTDLAKDVGSEVKDYRVDAVKIAGAVITLAIGFSENGEVTTNSLPIRIDVNEALLGTGRETKRVLTKEGGISIDFGQVPFDARPISDLNVPFKFSGIVYSACRSATVRFTSTVSYDEKQAGGSKKKISKKGDYEKTVKVSDPRFFQVVAFPAKGNVSFHDECGVSVTSSTETGQSSAFSITEALTAQGKAIKEAIEAAKKKEEK
jgi:hypothetical protein